MTAQLALPGIPVTAPRRRTRHTFGTPTGEYAAAQCKSCPVLRRYGPFGAKQGYRMQWSRDGKEWSAVEIPCNLKEVRR